MLSKRRLRQLTSCAAVGVLAALPVACGGQDSAECLRAATAQAQAETDWSDAIQEHSAAHSESQSHGGHEELNALRVNMILAEAEVRNACG